MTSKLQSLTTLWQEFDLPGTQRLLDDMATDITTRQDESDSSRKQLIEQIRGFKKNNTEEVRLIVGPLLKSFQNEIDNLNKRSKASEKSFFDIYKTFCDIADPVPTLEYCMESLKSLQKLQDYEIENNQLRETLAEYNTEMSDLKAKAKKLEEVEKKLEKVEESMDSELENKVSSKEQQLNVMFADKVRLIEEDKNRLETRYTEIESKNKNLQNLLDEAQSELFDLKSSQDAMKGTENDELELLLTDIERVNQRAATAEKELSVIQDKCRELKDTHDMLKMEEDNGINEESSELRLQLTAKEREVVQLFEDIQKVSKMHSDTELKFHKKVAEFERTVSELEKDREGLSSKLEKQSDYETTKKELSILKTLEFPSHDPSSSQDSRPLEVLILERSKCLQSENSMLRLDKERLVRDLSSAQAEVQDNSQRLSKQAELISQLEEHVEQLQAISTPYREEAEGRSSSDMLAEVLRLDKSGSDEVFDSLDSSPLQSSTPVPEVTGSSSLLPIVQAQRERFRLRNEELETESLEQQQQISVLSRQVQDLQRDNVKLFEKIRYLQSCDSGRHRGESSHVNIPEGSLAKYQSGYEQKLDPFHSFGVSEKQRKYSQLSVFEKVILSLVKFMASNKTARLAVFFYSVLLHGLVFAVLYKLALTESCKHDMAAQWHEKYIEHMQDVHGDIDHIG